LRQGQQDNQEMRTIQGVRMKIESDYIVILPEVADIFANWEQWVIVRKSVPVKCVGLESKYKSADVFERSDPNCEINILEAVEVEKIICGLPEKNKKAIKCWHILRLPPHVMRKKLYERDIGLLMRTSWLMVSDAMKKKAFENNLRKI
jgi:hypothetical protein